MAAGLPRVDPLSPPRGVWAPSSKTWNLPSLHLAIFPPEFGRVVLLFLSVWENQIKALSLAGTSVIVGLNERSIPSPMLCSLPIALPFPVKLFCFVQTFWVKKTLSSVKLNSQCLQEKRSSEKRLKSTIKWKSFLDFRRKLKFSLDPFESRCVCLTPNAQVIYIIDSPVGNPCSCGYLLHASGFIYHAYLREHDGSIK